jgi:hypothetical protein
MRYKILGVCLFCIFACGRNQSENTKRQNAQRDVVISAPMETTIRDLIEVDIREISEKLDLIRLETSESTLIGNINNVVLDDEYIIISSREGYFLFNRQGKFLRRLFDTGRGPDEFLYPRFSKTIRDGRLYFTDSDKSNQFIYSINLGNGDLGKITRANQKPVQGFVPDTDTSLIIVTSTFEISETPSMVVKELSIIRQDFKGEILSTIVPSYKTETNLSLPGSYSIFKVDEKIYLSNRRFDTLFHIQKDRLDPVWTNEYSSKYVIESVPQDIPGASLMSYLKESIIIERYDISLTYANQSGTIGAQRISKGLMMVDRLENSVINISKLFFLDQNRTISFNPNIKLDDNQFVVSMDAGIIKELLSDPRYKENIEKILVQDEAISQIPISNNDNPLLLVGRFSSYKKSKN